MEWPWFQWARSSRVVTRVTEWTPGLQPFHRDSNFLATRLRSLLINVFPHFRMSQVSHQALLEVESCVQGKHPPQ